MNKISKIILYALVFLIAPIILTGVFEFFLLVILGISMDEFCKAFILLIMYLLTALIFLHHSN